MASSTTMKALKCSNCGYEADFGHYRIGRLSGIEDLKSIFPTGEEADEMNFVLFSTSGIHGSYTTIEDIETILQKYGESPLDGESSPPDDYEVPHLTALLIQPRVVAMRYTGSLEVTLKDIPYLKKLRESSWKAVQSIGVR